MKGRAAYFSFCIAFLLIVGMSIDAAALPSRPPRRSPAAQSAQSLRTAGLQALSRGAFAEATKQLESAYRSAPDAKGLHLLCQLAWSEGRTLYAKDLARRYKAELQARPAGDAAREDIAVSLQEVARILAFPDEPTGELAILGPDGAFVLLDGRLAGRLPLSLPLLVSAGEHELHVESAQSLVKAHAQVPVGRMVEVRIQPESGSAVSTLIPAMAVWQEELGVPSEATPLLTDAVAEAARREHLSVIGWPLGSRPTSLADCAQSLDCLEELARRSGVTLVLHVRITGPHAGPNSGAKAAGWKLELRLFSGEIGELVSAKELPCAGCVAHGAAVELTGALQEALALARTRPRGVLHVRSEPAAAEVWSEGRRLGSTPYVHAAWAGAKQIELRLGHYLPWSGQMIVKEGQPTVLALKLRPEPLPAPQPVLPLAESSPKTPPRTAQPASRRRWRLLAGGVLLASGIVLAGFGVSGLSIAGQCSADTPMMALECRSTYSSIPIGATLTGVGGGLAVSGLMLALIPGKEAAKRRRPPPPMIATAALR